MITRVRVNNLLSDCRRNISPAGFDKHAGDIVYFTTKSDKYNYWKNVTHSVLIPPARYCNRILRSSELSLVSPLSSAFALPCAVTVTSSSAI